MPTTCFRLAIISFALGLTAQVSTVAFAQTSAGSATASATTRAPARAVVPVLAGDAEAPAAMIAPSVARISDHQRRALSPLYWESEPGQSVALGYDNGAWGGWWSQGLRLGIPLGRHYALHARGLYLTEMDLNDAPYTADAGGRLELIGRSHVFLNFVRLYGGGGVQYFQPVFGTEGRRAWFGGGGQFGFEFFFSPKYSVFLEVGGQGGKPAPGATVVAGMNFYPWND
jgi:hypothetical protein